MNNTFRDYLLNQPLLLPPDLSDWLPEKHLARFVCDLVGELNLGEFYSDYGSGARGGRPAYHPLMMVRLLVYAYCTGVYSSRKIEARTYDDVAFRFLTADQHPDHDSIAAFRKRHLSALEGLFRQGLQLCCKAGMVKLGHVATDGSKVRANASKHKAMSYERMGSTEKKLESEIAQLKTAKEMLDKAEQVDAEEDARYGEGKRGDEIPEELARRESRLRVIRKAKAALEAEAAAKGAEKAKEATSAPKTAGVAPVTEVTPATDAAPATEAPAPDPKAQRNFTDPDSRIMVDGANKAFVQAYNTQISVDSEYQVIVAAEVTQEANDKRQLSPMLEAVNIEMGRLPEKASADTGYFSEENLTNQQLGSIDLYVPPDRQKHGQQAGATTLSQVLTLARLTICALVFEKLRSRKLSRQAKELYTYGFVSSFAFAATLTIGVCPIPLRAPTTRDAARYKVNTPEGKAIYRRRKAIVEPVYGHIKNCRGFRKFSLRGLANVAAEWKFVAAVHNFLKFIKFKGDGYGIPAAGAMP